MSSSNNKAMIYDINRKEDSLLKRLTNRFIERVLTGTYGLQALTTVLAKAAEEGRPQAFRLFWAYRDERFFKTARRLGEPCCTGHNALVIGFTGFDSDYIAFGHLGWKKGGGSKLRRYPLDTLVAIKLHHTAGASRHWVRFTWAADRFSDSSADPFSSSFTASSTVATLTDEDDGDGQQLLHSYLWMDQKTQGALLGELAARRLLHGPPVQRGFGITVLLAPYWARVQAEKKGEMEEEEVVFGIEE